ncbi:uncharacterized protein LOC143283182 [Babylonia areolata]|uniref:uncharacterized protein LOC143283182 n=1 Tax=Babylonia areolata TaxID=304850 RepID=UPI003FD05C7D
MKVGHSLYFFKTPEEVRNATVYRDTAAHIEGAVLLTVSVVGGVGNLLVLCAPAVCSRYRTTSCAFLSHHCLLDSVKAVFCVPFACALLLDVDIPHCNAVGAVYIFLMTLSAYNLLALHINEEYQLTDRQGYIPGPPDGSQYFRVDKGSSFCCVSFGIFMIWFTTVLLHLGVAFLPSSAEFNYDIGNCVFNYGTPKNYVIHILWTMLVTGALLIAVVSFTLFFCRLRTRMHSEKWTLLHTSISQDMKRGTHSKAQAQGPVCPHRPVSPRPPHLPQDAEEVRTSCVLTEGRKMSPDCRCFDVSVYMLHYEFAEGVDQTATHQMKLCLRRVVVMLLMVLSFLLFWYPLFILTLLDVHYTRPPQTYRACMILAWSHPVTTPFFCAVIYFDMLSMRTLTRSVCSAAIPLKESTSFTSFQREEDTRQSHRAPQHRTGLYHLGFTNDNFSFSNHGSPGNRCEEEDGDDAEELCCAGGEGSGRHVERETRIDVTRPLTPPLPTPSDDLDLDACRSYTAQDSYQTLIM